MRLYQIAGGIKIIVLYFQQLHIYTPYTIFIHKERCSMKHPSISVVAAKFLCVVAVILALVSSVSARPADDMTMSLIYYEDHPVNRWYPDYIKVDGGVKDYTFNIVNGSMPPGGRIRQEGGFFYLDGIPNTPGTWKFTLRVTDRRNCCVEHEITVTIRDETYEAKDMLLSETFSDSGDAGAWYSSYVRVHRTDGKEISSCSLNITGTLPEGLYIRPAADYKAIKFFLEGIPTKSGDYTFTLRVTDKRGYYADESYTVRINGNYTAADDGSMKIIEHDDYLTYTYFEPTGWDSVPLWSVVNGTLPEGVSLVPFETVAVSLQGEPKTAGTYTFTLRATDTKRNVYADYQVTMKVNAPYEADDMLISGDLNTCWKLNEKYNGQKYNSQVVRKGGSGVNNLKIWSVVDGTLPPGLSLIQSGYVKSLGYPVYLEGIPNTAGTYTFTLRTTDDRNAYAEREFTVKINGTPYEADDMPITGDFSSGCKVNEKYSSSVCVQGSIGITRWSAAEGTLPPGLSLNPSGSAVSLEGIPNAAGTYTFTLRANDSRNAYAERQFSVTVTGEASSAPAKAEDMSITGIFSDAYVINTWYSSSVKVNGGTEDYTFSISGGSLPTGFFIRQSRDVFFLEGVPADPGTYTFTLKVIDSRSVYTESSFSMTINDTDDDIYPITITTKSLRETETGTPYSQTLEADVSVTSWTVTSGDLPKGLELSETTGVISGTVADDAIEHNAAIYLQGKPYKFEVTASNTFGAVTTKEFIIYVYEPLTIITESIPNARVGEKYSVTFEASGTSSAPLGMFWTLGAYTDIPPGLNYPYMGSSSHTCILSGTPTKAGSYSLSVECGNAMFCSKAKKFTLIVEPDPNEAKPEFKTHSLLLSGQIGVNFYMDLPEISGVDYADTYMDFDIAGDKSNPEQMYDPEFMNKKKTYYGFRCYIKSIQMADTISAVLHYGNNQTVTHEYSAKKYLDDSLAADIPDTERSLIEAIKDFGHYAQLYLSRVNGWSLGTAHEAIDCENEYSDSDIEAARQAADSNAIVKDVPEDSGIKRIGFSLNLDADTTINLYIYPEDGYTGPITAYIPGSTTNDAIYYSDRNRYKAEINNIPAHRLAETFTVKVVGKKEFDVKVSAFSYVYAALNDANAQADEINTVVSLYRYYTTNMDYRAANGL